MRDSCKELQAIVLMIFKMVTDLKSIIPKIFFLSNSGSS